MNHSFDSIQLRQLTGLRFFAALAVMMSHLSFLREPGNLLHGLAHTIFYEGYAGVTFFFVLSGFILSHTYQTKLASKALTTKKYLLLRVARVYPLHLLTAIPFAIGSWYELGSRALLKIGMNFTLLQSWVPRSEYYYSLNSVSWSLSNEIFFYSSFVLLVVVSNKSLARLAIIWAAAIMLGALLGMYLGRGSWSDGRVHYLFYISPVSRLLDFMVGMLVYRYIAKRPPKNTDSHEIISLVTLIVAMYIFSTFQFPDVLRSQLLYLPIMAYIVWSFSGRCGLVSNVVGSPSIVLLGNASFALYMIHQPIITHGVAAVRSWDIPIGPVMLATMLVALSILLSILVYRYIEHPIHARLRIWIAKSS